MLAFDGNVNYVLTTENKSHTFVHSVLVHLSTFWNFVKISSSACANKTKASLFPFRSFRYFINEALECFTCDKYLHLYWRVSYCLSIQLLDFKRP